MVWLPHYLGHGGALLLQLGVLAALAAWLWRGFVAQAPAPAAPAGVPPLGAAWRRLWRGRWSYWTGGLAVGLIGAFAIVRMKPLGVTATLGSACAQAQAWDWIPLRLDGLDGFAGCATAPAQGAWAPHALLLLGLVAGAFIGALASRQFAPRWPRPGDAARGLAGGVLLGWGAMTGLGCTIGGTLLSGSMAGALVRAGCSARRCSLPSGPACACRPARGGRRQRLTRSRRAAARIARPGFPGKSEKP